MIYGESIHVIRCTYGRRLQFESAQGGFVTNFPTMNNLYYHIRYQTNVHKSMDCSIINLTKNMAWLCMAPFYPNIIRHLNLKLIKKKKIPVCYILKTNYICSRSIPDFILFTLFPSDKYDTLFSHINNENIGDSNSHVWNYSKLI